MKTVRLQPQTLIQTAVKDAERALKAERGDRVLQDSDVAKLPAALRDVVDDFRAAGNAEVRTNDILGALRSALEAGLRQSLTKGELVPAELSDELGALLSFSSVGVQVQKAIADRASAAAADFASAAEEAQIALAQADLSVPSQVRVLKELARAAQLARSEAPDHALLLDGIAKDRAKIVRKVVDQTVKSAERALAERPNDAAAKQQLAAALDAAIEVHTAVNPKSARVKTLRQQRSALGAAPARKKPAQPFFARFLENQNRGVAQQQTAPDMMVTMKYPSDNEDGGGEPIATTRKFPSDAEDGGVEAGGGGMVTTMKAPSDHEDGGVDAPGGDIGAVTEKYPSDAEDGGANPPDDGGMVTTMKAPSDHEDGGVNAPDDGGMVTTAKFPSDNEDGGVDDGGGAGAVTEKYPSDAEDGGVDDGGTDFTTLKYPSDNEDGGAGDGGDVMVTLKFPSDNEDGGGDDAGGYVTLKYPSDNEDGGTTPDVGPVDGPTDAPATGGAAQRISDSILAVWQGGGNAAVEARIAELEDLGTRARFSAEGLREHNAEIACLKTLLGGVNAVSARVREIEQLMMVALLTPDASAALQLELDVLRLLEAAL